MTTTGNGLTEETIVVASDRYGGVAGAHTMDNGNAASTGEVVMASEQSMNHSPATPISSQLLDRMDGTHGLQFVESTTNATSTPVSFAQNSPSVVSNGPKPDVVRTGGRRSRGIRHRGSQMVGGSMSVFSVRPDRPRTPTSRAGGSVRSKSSRGSQGNNKRKRPDGNGFSDSESSENFTPLSQSRSGRKIVQATQTTPIIKLENGPSISPKVIEKTSPTSKASATKTVEKKRPSSKKTPGGASAVCKNCGRLHSPESNAMVFCDGCNTGWHQHCHDPPIPQDIVLIESKEWHCTDCVVLREEKSRLDGKVSGQHMSLLEKRRHLQTLSSKELVSLLLHACSAHPDLPVFSASSVEAREDLDEDEDNLPYPKPGNGLVLPPEKEHLHFLLDDDTDVYSHCTSGIAQLVAAARANIIRRSVAGLIHQPHGNAISNMAS